MGGEGSLETTDCPKGGANSTPGEHFRKKQQRPCLFKWNLREPSWYRAISIRSACPVLIAVDRRGIYEDFTLIAL